MQDKILVWGIWIFLLVTLGIGVYTPNQINGDSINDWGASRELGLPLAAATVIGQSGDANATLGNTDLAATSRFWAGASLSVGLVLCLLLMGLFFAKPWHFGFDDSPTLLSPLMGLGGFGVMSKLTDGQRGDPHKHPTKV